MENSQINLGVIGMSEGNGHPYSWSAIFNGYNPIFMNECPFPVIPEYLANENWPDAQIKEAKVTHIWTQDKMVSKHIASASLIPHIVGSWQELVSNVDAVLLARDDASNHLEYATPFLEAGIPIFIDKPLALNVKEANLMLSMQKQESQLFSCSSLRYAKELYLTETEKQSIGDIVFMEAQIPKAWDKYAVHLLEPIIAANPNRGALIDTSFWKIKDVVKSRIMWNHLEAYVSTYGDNSMPFEIIYHGKNGIITKKLEYTFSAFKSSLTVFIEGIQNNSLPIPRSETLEIVQIIEAGINA